MSHRQRGKAAIWAAVVIALGGIAFLGWWALGPGADRAVEGGTGIAVEPAPDTAPVGEAARSVPSGQPVEFIEAIHEEQDGGVTWLRLRFVAPRIGGQENPVEFEVASEDMLFLCEQVGLAVVAQSARPIDLIVISLSAEATVFGETYPDVIQFFDAFRPENDACMWEENW